MNNILVKVYGQLESQDEQMLNECYNSLQKICESWYLDAEIIDLDNGLLQISHEGEYFPIAEVAEVLQKCISEQSKGKLDYINLEDWTLTRYFLDYEHNKNQTELYFRKSSLNHAIAEAQEKCSKYKG